MSASVFADRQDIATPPGAGTVLARLIAGPLAPALAARAGIGAAKLWGRPFRVGRTVIVARHADVREVLARDLDFRIAPVNAGRIGEVNGPFVLGTDRCPKLSRERDALYRALSKVDQAPLRAAAAEEAAARIAAAGDGPLDVVQAYARPVAAGTARLLFGIGGTSPAVFMDVARAIFAHTFLNVAGDPAITRRALAAAALMREWLGAEIARRRVDGQLGADMMGALLSDAALDDDGVRRTLGGMLVGSIDTTASAVAKIVWVAGRDRTLARAMTRDAGDEALLGGWCREALRRWPHNPILMRRALAPTRLGGTEIRAGDTVIAWTQAAMQDPETFPEPSRLRPDRPAGAYLHLGGGLHPCAGRAVNAWQIPLLVGGVLRRGAFSTGAMRWAGPFPAHLDLAYKQQSTPTREHAA